MYELCGNMACEISLLEKHIFFFRQSLVMHSQLRDVYEDIERINHYK